MERRRFNTRASFLVPLALAILVLCLVTIIIGIKNDYIRESNELKKLQEHILEGFYEKLKYESTMLESNLHILGKNEKIQKAWQSQQRDLLYKESLPYFNDLNKKFDITHFYFIGIDVSSFCGYI